MSPAARGQQWHRVPENTRVDISHLLVYRSLREYTTPRDGGKKTKTLFGNVAQSNKGRN